MSRTFLSLIWLFQLLWTANAVKRHEALADRAQEAGADWLSPYSVVNPSFSESTGAYAATLQNALFPNTSFSLDIYFHKDGVARVQVDEVNGLKQRYNQASQWTLIAPDTLPLQTSGFESSLNKDTSTISYANKKHKVVIQHSPLKLTFYRNGLPHVVLNQDGLFNMEHFRLKSDAADKDHAAQTVDTRFSTFLDDQEDGMWEESFGGHQDTKPKGPESLSMDISFLGYEHVYGIPQHSGSLSLKTTRGGEGAYDDPYRLYNLDVFEYDHDSPMSIYGSIPFMQAHRADSTVGIFWLSASETWIDITKQPSSKPVLQSLKHHKSDPSIKTTTSTHWMSESGILDLFVFLGDADSPAAAATPDVITKQFTDLVGTTSLPQLFAIGHHQCRWNYINQEDVLTVSSKFDEYDIPLDVIWLDIEYADEHKYFDWRKDNFPEPIKMQQGLADRGRKLVAIVDPHIKRVSDFYVYKEAQELDILYKKRDGSEYEGWCWTGSSSWVDFFNPRSHEWWINLFKYDKFWGSTKNLFVWNDMNEPAVFNGPEITAPKDNLHYGGWEHRDIHNINGMIFHNLTASALTRRDAPESRRPFVLSRAFFAGSQKYGAIWTGDNLGTWEHLEAASRMILANGVGGMAWSGADIGGFFGNPSEEMLVRWYQAGAFHPFFRAHAHIDTKRREPYLFDEPIRGLLRDALRLRYALLPTWYTAFWDSSRLGVPIATPHYVAYPNDHKGFAIDDQYFVGHQKSLLFKPIVQEGASSASVYLPPNTLFYNYYDYAVHAGQGEPVTLPVTLETTLLFHRGGSILPRRDLIRRSAPLMWRDPVTLVVALDSDNTATGQFYSDDGESFEFKEGHYVWRQFDFKPVNKHVFSLSSVNLHEGSNKWTEQLAPATVGKVIVLGLAGRPSCVRVSGKQKGLLFDWNAGRAASAKTRGAKEGTTASSLVTETELPLTQDWTLEIDLAAACDVGTLESKRPSLESPLCPANHFQCANTGHIPSCLLLSRVNDGLCDPECCDGSDEFDGKVACPNTCKEVSERYQRERAEALRKQKVGSQLRADYIKFGQAEKTRLEAMVKTQEAALQKLQAKSRSMRDMLEQAEATSAAEIERKKQSAVYRRLEEHQHVIRSLRLKRVELAEQLETLTRMLEDLQKGYNPNYQDMAVKGVVKAFEEWQKEDHTEAESEGTELSDEQLEELEEQDLLSLVDANEVTKPQEAVINLFKLEDYLPPTIKPYYKNVMERIVSALSAIGVIHPVTSLSEAERSDIVKARTLAQDAEKQVREQEEQLSQTKADLDKDWGRDWEWKKLDNFCVSKDMGEYTYEVCLFGSARQKPNHGHSSTLLGKFASWNPSADKSVLATYYSRQLYDAGQKCWNGPERSVVLDISCGTRNELLTVLEPYVSHKCDKEVVNLICACLGCSEKCEYHFKMTSPAVCYPPSEDGIDAGRVKKEL